MKWLICTLACVTAVALILTACGGDKNGQTLYVKDEFNSDSVSATFINSETKETKEVTLTKSGTTDSATEFTCTADPDKYDRVVLTAGSTTTIELAFNRYTTGWELGSKRFYPYDNNDENPKFKRVSFDYENRTKDVLIWTPEDYDETSSTKYSVIYMTDGQNLFDPSATSTGSWGVAESIRAMIQQKGEACIIVGIENADGFRDSELTPDIGTSLEEGFEDGEGEYFSDFVVNTVMPYVEENYNVYTDRDHTSVCGSSSGGIESFYIAMEHPDLFGSCGAISPAFLLFSDSDWVDYLSEKDFSAGYPTVYIYSGNSSSDDLEQAICTSAEAMPDNLAKINYPEDKIITKIYDEGMHNEMHWRAIFPDYLKYAFPISTEETN